MVPLSKRQVREIALAAYKDDRTVGRVYRGDKTHATTRDAVAAAASKLGHPSPPPASDREHAA